MKTKLRVIKGDITLYEGDAVVNAANTGLTAGHGVCGAIYEAAGEDLHAATDALGGCPTGGAKITPGFNMKAKMIVHAVGPVYGTFKYIKSAIAGGQGTRVLDTKNAGQNGEEYLLKSAYLESLVKAFDKGARSIAFPCISTGIYGYPQDKAAKVAIRSCLAWLQTFPNAYDEVVFYTFLDADYELYKKEIEDIIAEFTQQFEVVPATASAPATVSANNDDEL